MRDSSWHRSRKKTRYLWLALLALAAVAGAFAFLKNNPELLGAPERSLPIRGTGDSDSGSQVRAQSAVPASAPAARASLPATVERLEVGLPEVRVSPADRPDLLVVFSVALEVADTAVMREALFKKDDLGVLASRAASSMTVAEMSVGKLEEAVAGETGALLPPGAVRKVIFTGFHIGKASDR